MLSAVGFSPVVVNLSVSAPSEALPTAVIAAPLVLGEWAQPRFTPPAGFPQGHARTPPTPGSHSGIIGLETGFNEPMVAGPPTTVVELSSWYAVLPPVVHPG